MSLEHYPELSDILAKVNGWPVSDRILLAQQLLERIKDDLPEEKRQGKSLRDLVGLLKTENPPPTDEQCREIIEEARQEKYGR